MSAARTVGALLLVLVVGCASAADKPAAPARAKAAAKVEKAPPASSAAAASARPRNAPTEFSFRDESPEGTAAWPVMEPEEAGFDREKLKKVIQSAKASQSSSLLVLKDGKMVVEQYFGQPRRAIETMSVTKSVVSIAIGMLIADKKIASVDVPLSKYYPEFAGGKKAKITLYHLLTQTSGLEHADGAGKMSKEKDRLAYARARGVVSAPGTTFSYNNEATQLLSGIVAKAAGKPIDEYLAERLFKPLDITEWKWERDGAGNVQAFYGLSLHARDLAKIGVLFANGGTFGEKEILPGSWVRQSTTPAKPGESYGYLWWLRYDRDGRQVGFAADGWLGQQLFVSPSLGVVIVRQHEAPDGFNADGEYNKKVAHFSLRGEIEAAMTARAN
ncbi:MAG: serine hydrolase [Polyangiaceae bacterium]|nr:serine hydrolase [Polyangiaceae bacterium]